MPFVNKGQYLLTAQQTYEDMKNYNKMLREQNISDEKELTKIQPQTANNKQSGFCK